MMKDRGLDYGMDEVQAPPGSRNANKSPLDHLCRFVLFEKGQTLFEEGGRGNEAYIIKSGSVKISQASSSDLGTFGPGEIIGELAVISDMGRIATATALEETVCVGLSRQAMQHMMDSVDMEMRTIIEFLVDYIRDVTEGTFIDDSEADRSSRILQVLIDSPETQNKLALQEPFFQLLCKTLLDRAGRNHT
ncbi:cyclic nucleotide-binding domain-containing protein [Magnetovibrio sp. PR-2]|uniref:cyclic nucleotide-binding domain-containing protein n=1 Tax=Magnetovibrio sp. PR-2 TaxID=3120356 RepID=UPI002FCDF392